MCIRDRAFHAAPQALVLAPTPEAALRGAGLAPEPDEAWVAGYLAGYETSARASAFRGVERLPPGHLILAEGGRVEVRRWWRLEPQRLAPADLAPEALAEALHRATRAALRGGPAAAFLSGGLDSSALAVLAARAADAPQLALSLRFPADAALDEGPWIEAVRAAGRFDAREVDATGAHGPGLTADTLDRFGQPADGFGAGTARALYRAAAAAGARTVIDGHGGDEVVGHGGWHLGQLARQGRWRALWRLARDLRRFERPSDLSDPLLHLAQHGPWPLAPALRRLRRQAPADATAWRALVRPDLARRTDLVARVRAAEAEAGAPFPPETRPHAALLTAPRTASAFEALASLAAAEGVAPRYPFYDARVVALCLNRPEATKIAGGRPRDGLRAAMAGLLPEAVRLRPGKADFLPALAAALRADPEGRVRALHSGPTARLAPFVAPEALVAAGRALDGPGLPPAEALFGLWRAVTLDRWLERLAAGGRAEAHPAEAEARAGKA
jgi:asparagine synthase (glutamine-hydrolysing)